jgi:predicted glutamine amidotransferase
MCRLFALKKSESSKKTNFEKTTESFLFLREVGHNLVGSGNHGHKDGFGAVFYFKNRDKTIIKSLENPFTLKEKIDENFNSDLNISLMHLRKSTIGAPSLVNTHPFIHDNISFIHNGSIAKGVGVPYKEMSPVCLGETDSERFLMKIISLKDGGLSTFDAYKETVLDIMNKYEDYYSLNSVITEGGEIYAVRVLNEKHVRAKETFFDDYFTLYLGVDDDKNVYISSEALADSSISWKLLPNYTIVKIDKENSIKIDNIK